jgi:hypothetical protein
MHHSVRRILMFFSCVSLAFALAPQATSAAARATQSADYMRVLFTFDGENTMRLKPQGSTLILHFDAPITLDAQALQQQMREYALGVQSGDGGKSIIINLKKPYRIRQFISQSAAGFDIMTSASVPKPAPQEPEPPIPAPQPDPKPQAKPAPTPAIKKPAVPKPLTSRALPPRAEAPPVPVNAALPPRPAAPPVPINAAPPSDSAPNSSIVPPSAPASPLTTRDSAAPTPAKPEAPKGEAPETETPTPPPTPALTTKEAPIADAVKPGVYTTKPIEKPVEKPTETVAASPPPAAAEALSPPAAPAPSAVAEPKSEAPVETPPPPAPKAAPGAPMPVGMQPSKDGPQLVFPWEERTAAAVFQRGRDGWILFSRPATIDLPQLRSILPVGITHIEQYSPPGMTLLKLTTDGRISFLPRTAKGKYEWLITLSPIPAPVQQAYAIEPIADAAKPYVLIKAFDIAEPLSFVDPKRGDKLLLIPSYETGKAVISPYRNADFAFLPASQGIALTLTNENVTTAAGRDGLRIETANGLKLTANLPALPISTPEEAAATADVMLPYARWRVDAPNFARVRSDRVIALANASEQARPQALYDLTTLYLGQGFAQEALSLLNRLRDEYPAFYRERQLAIVRAAANFMMSHMSDAAEDIRSDDVLLNPESRLWRDAISIFVPRILLPPEADPTTPTPIAGFDYLAYNRAFIQYYPPEIRQKLAIAAADHFITLKEYSKAARTLDILNRDGLLDGVHLYAEYLLGKIAAENGKTDQAIKLWKPLSNQYIDPLIRARAQFSLVTLEYASGRRSLKDTITPLEKLRIAWRGDTLEQNLLVYLGQLYSDTGDYASALRTWDEFLSQYGASAEALDITQRMAVLFENLFSKGKADTMPPLKSLALFYEFRKLTPIGARGDAMIQNLAYRLAKVDLLDRAAALLEHQVKFRLQGVARARAGAQLAVLHLLNKKPESALRAIELSGYGASPPTLAAERNRLTALALWKIGKPQVGLEVLAPDSSPEGQRLRLEILWGMQDWPNIVNVAEDILGNRPDIAEKLTPRETEVLLKLALAYSFENDLAQLRYLRDYYTPLLAQSPYKDIFKYLTNDTAPLAAEDFEVVATQISDTEDFLKIFREKIRSGRLNTIGDVKAADDAKSLAPSVSEQNRALVPESNNEIPAAPTVTEDAAAPAPNAPITVEPGPNQPTPAPQAAPITRPAPAAGETAAPKADPAAATAPPSQTPPQSPSP